MRLIVMRHGRAQPDAPKGDHARSLATSGREDASSVGAQLVERGERPRLVLVSSSARTRETLEALPVELTGSAERRELDAIYNASLETLLHILEENSNGADILLIGHNPGLTALVLHLDGAPEADGLRPADCVVLELSAPPFAAGSGNRLARLGL